MWESVSYKGFSNDPSAFNVPDPNMVMASGLYMTDDDWE